MALGPGDDQRGAGDQRPEELPHRHVEAGRRLLQHPVVRAEAVGVLHPQQAVDDALVRDDHALGAAGGAGGVDDVRRMPGVVRRRQLALRAGGQDVADHAHRAGVLDHEGEPVRRVVRVQRQVGGTGAVRGEEGHDQVGRARQGDGDGPLRTRAETGQHPGGVLDPGVQLGIGEPLLLEDEGGGVGGAGNLGTEQLGERAVRDRPGGVVPAGEDTGPLVLVEDVQVPEQGVRFGGCVCEEPGGAAGQGFGRAVVEEVGGVLQEQDHAVGLVDVGEVQVELGHAGVHVGPLGGQAEHVGVAVGPVVVAEHDLEERVAAGRPGRVEGLHHPVERQVLVLEGGQRRLPDPAEEFTERQPVAGQVGAQHQGVDEEAHQVAERLVGAARDGRAEGDVVARAEPVQQGGGGGLEQHEHAGAGGRREVAQGEAGGSGQLQPDLATASGRLGGAGPVGGQRQLVGQPAQGVPPVGELGLTTGREQLPLPEGVVGVLHGQRRPLRGPVRAAGRVGGVEVGEERPVGPLVGGDVVQDDRHHVVAVGQPEHLAAQREFGREVEGTALGRLDQRGQRLLGGRCDGEGRVGLLGGDDPLVRLAVVGREHGAQRLVAGGHVPQGGAQGLGVEVAAQPEDQREVVGDTAAGDLLDEQQPALGRGQRDPGGPVGHRGDGRPGGVRRADAGGEPGRGGGLEEVADGEFGAQFGAGAADQPGGEQRVAAQVEEVVLRTGRGQPEHLREQAAEHLLLRGAGAASAAEGDGGFGLGQGAHVQLAVGVHGQAVDGDEGGRDHVLGQLPAEVLAQPPDQGAGLAGGGGVVGVGGGTAAGAEQAAGEPVSCGQEDRVVGTGPRRPGGQYPVSGVRAERVQGLRVDAVLDGAAVRNAGDAQGGGPFDARAVADPAGQPAGRIQQLADSLGGPAAAGEFAHGVGGGPLDRRRVVQADVRLTGVQDDVVAVPGQLVVVAAALGAQVDAVAEGGEVVGVDQEFLLQAQPALHRPLQVGRRRSAGALDLGVEGPGEPQVADVADEQGAAGREQLHGAVDDGGEVLDAREVLDDGVDDDRVEVAGGQAAQVVGGPAPQFHSGSQLGVPGPQLRADLADHRGGEVGRPVLLGVRGEPGEQQAGADADFEDAARLEGADAGDGGLAPLVHLLEGDGPAVVGAVPAVVLLGEDGGADLLVLVGVDLLPLPHLRGLGGGAVGGVGAGGHDVADETFVADHDRGLGDQRVAAEGGLDLAGFDAVAADLDLVVGAAEEVEVAVGAPAHQVSGAVHALARLAERVGDEPLRGQGGPVEVAAGESDARDVQLAGDAVGHRAQPGVQEVGAGAADRLAHGGGVGVEGAAAEGVDGVLGRPVQVVAVGTLGVAQGRPHRLRDRLAAEQDQRRHMPLQQALLDQQPGIRGRHVDDVDAVLLAVGDQRLRVAPQLLVADVHFMALDQPEQFLPRHVEGEGHGVRDPQPSAARGGDRRLEDLLLVVELHVRQTPVGGDDALGAAGGAGGVDDVGGVFEAEAAADGGVRQPGQFVLHRPVVEQDARQVVAVEGRGDGGGGEQEQRAGVGQHQGEPVGRVVQFQGQVGGAGAQDGEERDHHVQGSAQAERDDPLRTGAPLDEQPGHPVDGRVEFGVGQRALAEDEGTGVRGARGLGGEQVGDGLLGDLDPAGRPLLAQRRVLGGQQRVEGAHGCRDFGGEPLDEEGEAVEQGTGPVGRDQVGPVGEGDRDPLPGGDDEVGRVVGGVDVGDGGGAVPGAQLRQPVLGVVVAQHEQRVEQLAVPGLGLEHAEAEMLVRHQVEALALDAAEQVEDRLGGVEGDPGGDGVEEQADDVPDVVDLAGPAGDGGAEHDVGAAGRGGEGEAPGRVEQGVQGEAVDAAGLPQPVAESGGEAYVELVGDDRFEAVGGRRGEQGGLLQTGQRGAPGGGGGRVVLLVQPGQVVPVAAGAGQRGGVAAGLVQGEQFVQEEPGRPAVPEDQVAADDESVAAPGAEAQQEQPEQRGCGQVEPPVAFGLGQHPHPLVLFGGREVGEVDLVERDLRGLRGLDDELHRLVEAFAGEARAETRIAVEERARGGAQPGRVQAGGEVEGLVDGVDVQRALVVGRVEEQALLEGGQRPDVGDGGRGGERADPGVFGVGEGEGGSGGGRGGRGGTGGGREGGGRAVGEDVPWGEVQAGRAGPAGDADGADAVAAEPEEVVVRADVGDAEDGREDLGEPPLRRSRGLAAGGALGLGGG